MPDIAVGSIGLGQVPLALPPTFVSAIAGAKGQKPILGYYNGSNSWTNINNAFTTYGHTPGKSGTFYCDGSTNASGLVGTTFGAFAAAQAGANPLLSLGWILFSGSAPSGTVAPLAAGSSPYNGSHQSWDWATVLAGGCDPIIAQWGAGIVNLFNLYGKVVLIHISHEPDVARTLNTTNCAATLFAPMVRYLDAGLKAAGAGGMYELSTCVSSLLPSSALPFGPTINATTLTQIYQLLWGIPAAGYTPAGGPLDDIVHWKLWDPYITAPSQAVTKLTDYKTTYIDSGLLGTQNSSCYYGLGEFGVSAVGSGGMTAAQRVAYINAFGSTLASLDLAACFDSVGTFDSRIIGTSDGSVAAMTTAATSFR